MTSYTEMTGSSEVEAVLCAHIDSIRVARNITQQQLSTTSGVSVSTLSRMKKGQGISMDTFIRVMMALNIHGNFEMLLPDPSVRPMERVNRDGKERKRARPSKKKESLKKWTWGEDDESKEGND